MAADSRLRAVVADDDAFARRVTKHALEAAGMTVVAEATDGREAVELSLRLRPDLVAIDVVMPRLDGILATRRILEADPGQLVVVLTGAGEDELGFEALQAGAVDAVPKDAAPDVMTRALDEARREGATVARSAD